MAESWKQRRLLEAKRDFYFIDRLMDLLITLLFVVPAIATANKLLPSKIVKHPLLDLSWEWIIISFTLFTILFIHQYFDQIRRYRALSDFELEAALKANRRKTLRRNK